MREKGVKTSISTPVNHQRKIEINMGSIVNVASKPGWSVSGFFVLFDSQKNGESQ